MAARSAPFFSALATPAPRALVGAHECAVQDDRHERSLERSPVLLACGRPRLTLLLRPPREEHGTRVRAGAVVEAPIVSVVRDRKDRLYRTSGVKPGRAIVMRYTIVPKSRVDPRV